MSLKKAVEYIKSGSMFDWNKFESRLIRSGDFDPINYNLPDLSIGIDRKSLTQVIEGFQAACEIFEATNKPDPSSSASLNTRWQLAKIASAIPAPPVIDVFTDADTNKAAAIMYISGKYGFCLPGVHIDFAASTQKEFGLMAHSRIAEFYKGAMALAAFHNTESPTDAFGNKQVRFSLFASECGFNDALLNLDTVCAEFNRIKGEFISVNSLSTPSILLQIVIAEIRKESLLQGRIPYSIKRLEVSGSTLAIDTLAFSEEEIITPGIALVPDQKFINKHVVELRLSDLHTVEAKHVSFYDQQYSLN